MNKIVATPQAVPAPTQGEYGFGLHWSEHYASATVDAAAYLPLISYNSAGAQLAASSTLLHLDFHVDDLREACVHALRVGARLADFQPQPDVRVLLDPDGHPFCLTESGGSAAS